MDTPAPDINLCDERRRFSGRPFLSRRRVISADRPVFQSNVEEPLRLPSFLEVSLYIMTERASAKTITADIGRYR